MTRGLLGCLDMNRLWTSLMGFGCFNALSELHQTLTRRAHLTPNSGTALDHLHVRFKPCEVAT